MSEQKMTVASLSAKLDDEVSALKATIAEMAKRIEQLEVSNLQMRTELLELRNVPKSVAKPTAAKPTEPRMEDGVYTFIPPTANVTAVSSTSRDKVKLDGNIVECTNAVWAFWKTQLERRQKASARELAQYEEYCA